MSATQAKKKAKKPTKAEQVVQPDVICVGAAKAGAMFDMDGKSWKRKADSGRVPRHWTTLLGNGKRLWRLVDLQEWSDAGCPVPDRNGDWKHPAPLKSNRIPNREALHLRG